MNEEKIEKFFIDPRTLPENSGHPIIAQVFDVEHHHMVIAVELDKGAMMHFCSGKWIYDIYLS